MKFTRQTLKDAIQIPVYANSFYGYNFYDKPYDHTYRDPIETLSRP